jgi:uncharacterized protein (TIGR02300 family)
VAKPELGTKRLCAHCGAKFYDLNHAPIACPKCGTVFEAVQVSARGRAEAARAAVREVEPVVPETQEAEFVRQRRRRGSPGQEEAGRGSRSEDEVELDDEPR